MISIKTQWDSLFLGNLNARYTEVLSLNKSEPMFQSTIGPAIYLFLRSSKIPANNLHVHFDNPNDRSVCFFFA